MHTLSWSSAEVEWQGRTWTPTDAHYDGDVVLLFGDFRWLFALLAGEARRTAGSVSSLGQDAREGVVQGRVGVSPVALQPAPHWPVIRWLELNIELAGTEHGGARRRARDTLERLALTGLADRPVHELNGAESFAAHAAFAASTAPELLVLGAPLLLPETREYELAVVRRLVEQARVALACSRRDEGLWQLANEFAYCADRPGARTTLPIELFAQSACYQVTPFDPAPELARALEELGAEVLGPLDRLPWLVTVPEGGADLIVEAARRAAVPLAELVSVPEAR